MSLRSRIPIRLLLSALNRTNPNSRIAVLASHNSLHVTACALKTDENVNPYPPIGTTSEEGGKPADPDSTPSQKKRKRVILVGALVLGLIAGVYDLLEYAKKHSEFRQQTARNFPVTKPIFDYFLGPYNAMSPAISVKELKEEVKEEVHEVGETMKNKISRNLPMPGFLRRMLDPPPTEIEEISMDLAASGMLPNADPAYFASQRTCELVRPVGPMEQDEYTVHLLSALKHAQAHVADAISLKKQLIHDYEGHHVFLLSEVSMASRNEETDARKAIARLRKVIANGKTKRATARNPYIRSAAASANHFAKQLDQLDYLTALARQKGNSDANSTLVWD